MYQRSIWDSFRLAGQGLIFVFNTERNMKIHCAFAVMAVVCSVVFRIQAIEFIFIILSITLVMIAETANTAFELLLDFVHGDRYHPDVKMLKDVAAGGVFIATVNAVVVGLVIFLPRFYCIGCSLASR